MDGEERSHENHDRVTDMTDDLHQATDTSLEVRVLTEEELAMLLRERGRKIVFGRGPFCGSSDLSGATRVEGADVGRP
jgi:hypothetical protein